MYLVIKSTMPSTLENTVTIAQMTRGRSKAVGNMLTKKIDIN